jgi:hypothetical protein
MPILMLRGALPLHIFALCRFFWISNAHWIARLQLRAMFSFSSGQTTNKASPANLNMSPPFLPIMLTFYAINNLKEFFKLVLIFLMNYLRINNF